MLRNRAKRKYETVAQEIQFSEFYRTAINLKLDWAFTQSRFEGVAINEHFLPKACFSTLRGNSVRKHAV